MYPANASECDRFSAITDERKKEEHEYCIKLKKLHLYLDYLQSIPPNTLCYGIYTYQVIFETQYIILWCSGKGASFHSFKYILLVAKQLQYLMLVGIFWS